MSKAGIHGIASALGAALLFGTGTPLAKLLLAHSSPWLLAALLYLGSGLGLFFVRFLRRTPTIAVARGERIWFAGAVLSGGVIAPVLLMLGLSTMPASGASLLLNAEGVLTALLAWFVFREHVDRRIALGMVAIVAGSLVLTWPGETSLGNDVKATILVLAACLAWAIDNNLTRKVSLADASYIAMVKGLVAGSTNLLLALSLHAAWPEPLVVVGALALGFASYGASLTLFVLALRYLGTARTGTYFSVAPFFGAMLAIGLLQEPLTSQLLLASALMIVGVVLHLIERHEHLHEHEAITHEHAHIHGDESHHEHFHGPLVAAGTKHSHRHTHAPLKHSHVHFPDMHHSHRH